MSQHDQKFAECWKAGFKLDENGAATAVSVEGQATHNTKFRIIYRKSYISLELNECKAMFKCAPHQ
eukprot:6362953-Pyramimonas_sp.AAC.1